jgi:hypothetical protein
VWLSFNQKNGASNNAEGCTEEEEPLGKGKEN